jgi:AcrR family transcriptional regulator
VTLLERAHELTASHLAQRLDSVDDPVERIELWVRALFDLVRTPSSVAQNRPLLIAHPRLMTRFAPEINAGFDALSRPLEHAIAEARADAGLPAGDPGADARLALHQVFGMILDAAAVGTPPSRQTIGAVVSYTMRAVLGAMPDTPVRRRGAARRG